MNICKTIKILFIFSIMTSFPSILRSEVLVFGGTGELGSEIVYDLLEANKQVTVFTRPTSKKNRLKGLDVKYLTGDVLNEVDVKNAITSKKFEVIIDALARDRNIDADFYEISMQYISRWAKETKVKQVILHGSVGAGISRKIYPSERYDAMKDLLSAKDIGERYLIESGVNYTIIRNLILLPNDVKESGKAFLTEDQLARGGVTRDALARLTLECLNKTSCLNKVYHAIDNELVIPERHSRWKKQIDSMK